MSECTTNDHGDKYWYQNGKYHRLDGPALEFADGYKEWFINGDRLSATEVDLS